MKTILVTVLGLFVLSSVASAYPKYDNGRPSKRTTVAVKVDSGSTAKTVAIKTGNFTKGPGYTLK